ncbi:toll-like receptor 4 [Haliotis rufescens]|uniref:toll-like receptor 4 n=1 Tax=Haliotis rufescens TaxID=6454 RepID=UPI00201F7F60|nr:toll-like receptor 4 [Haliotis rufescens]
MLTVRLCVETQVAAKMLLPVLCLFLGCLTPSQGGHLNITCKPCVCSVASNGKLIANCSDKHLSSIPETIPNSVSYLCLSHNRINPLPGRSFQRFIILEHLDLSFNQLSRLQVDTFIGATNLIQLSLHGNSLPLNETAYPEGIFKQQKRLRTLNIEQNSKVPDSVYPDKALGDLTALRTLVIDGVRNATFGNGFSKLKNLTKLTVSGERGNCSIQKLLNTSFLHIPSVRYLDISKCGIDSIEASAFWPLRHIDTLDISNNQYLGFDSLGEAVYGLRFSSLRVLKINRIVATFAIGVHIKQHNFRYFTDLNVKEIYIDSNRVELIDEECLSQMKTVELVSIKRNRVTFGSYLLSLNVLTNLRQIYVENQYASNIPFVDSGTPPTPSKNPRLRSEAQPMVQYSRICTHACEAECTNSSLYRNFYDSYYYNTGYEHVIDFVTIQLPPNLTYANISNSKLNYDIRELRFHRNQLRTVDLSHNVFTRWIGPIHESHTVEYLDLSDNYCTHIAPTFFMFASGLKILNISRNYLSMALQADRNGQILFNQTNLEVLSISNNLIRELPSSIFKRLTRLQVLDLSWNMMTSWTVEISHMTHLHTLDISENRYEDIPIQLTDQIDQIMIHRNDSLHLSIKGNILKCDCTTLDSLEWITRPYISIKEPGSTQCRFSNGEIITFLDIEDIIVKLQLQCKIVIPLISTAVVGILFSMFVFGAGMVYRYRWKLRYLYYTTRRKYRGYQRLREGEDHFTYDAFVSYADGDRGFVIEDMRTVLERHYGLRLCIHHRDFMVGEAITANIINAIQSSRKTIAVLSPDFAKSAWCDYEVHMAKLESIHTGRDVLCVLWYTDIPDTRILSRDIRDQINYDTYIKYPTVENDKEEFWEKIKAAVSF